MNVTRDQGSRVASDRAVYSISVAADLTGLGVQTLRLYESHGLLTPMRTPGGTRRYSADDLARLERVVSLISRGINLVGVSMVLRLEDENKRLRRKLGARPQ